MQSKEPKGARAREGGQRPLGPEDATENGRALLRRFVPGRVAALPARARSAAVKDLRENITKRVEAMSAALEELTPGTVGGAPAVRKRCMCTCRPCLSSPPPPGLRWAIRVSGKARLLRPLAHRHERLSLGSEPLVYDATTIALSQ